MRAHILVVDDERGPREALEFVLQRESQWWRVSTAGSFEEAREVLDREDPERGGVDVVLTDLVMGRDEAAGMRLVEHVHRRDPFLMVILFTAKSKSLNRLEAFEHGAFDCIEKNILGHAASSEIMIKTRAALRFRRMALSHIESLRAAQEAQEALQRSEERYALAARGANDGLWDWDVIGGTIYFSPRWKNLVGYAEREIGNNPDEWWQRVHEDDLTPLMGQIEAHFEGRSPQFVGEYRMRHADGSIRWMLSRGLAIRDDSGHAVRMAGSQTDITDRKLAEEQLRHRTFHDALTGLPNRMLFLDRLEHAIRRGSRSDLPGFDVVLLGVDRFKLVNETYGHPLGDRLLSEIGERIRSSLRPGDTAARLGGDQFAVLLEDTELDSTLRMTERLQRRLDELYDVDGEEIRLSCTFAVVPGQAGYVQAQDVLRDADVTFYRAKARGKARIEVFDAEMREQPIADLHLETDLRRALEQGELLLFYQPLVHLDDGRLFGFEALIRWLHPVRGLVSPGAFIPLAEETGLINSIGRWVLGHAMHQLREWHRRFTYRKDLALSINVSGVQLQEGRFASIVERCLNDSRVDPSTVHLEITETVLMENRATVLEDLERVRRLGVEIYIDDFGTGYSSIGVLHELPIAALKIDRSFVDRLRSGEADSSLVASILTMAEKRRLKTIAEGVETLDQLSALRDLGCELGQGYLFSEPVPAARAESLIQSGQPV